MDTDKASYYFMGIEISTQQVKSVIIDGLLSLKYEAIVQFDTELPEFGTTGGAHKSPDGLTITSPVTMWVKAVDLVLDKLKQQGVDFSRIKAVSGNGQQHGSVYWKTGGEQTLSNLTPHKPMWQQLQCSFATKDCPIWMDSSTTSQCRLLEHKLGGAMEVAKLTGSRAYERFTGNQIMKIYNQQPDVYQNTERVSLVSSFACSLILGRYACIDLSDGSGMNLLDIGSKQWHIKCAQLCGGETLIDKLGEPVDSSCCLGNISEYLVQTYGFSPECKVIAFTGDNPASLSGMLLSPGDLVVSLGSSDTVFAWISEASPQLEGHIFVNPISCQQYMALLCFKNGSLTRDRVKKECAGDSWDQFNSALAQQPVGNNGNIGIYFDVMEIVPPVVGCYRWNADDVEMGQFPPAVEVRACVEGQLLAKRYHAEKVGYHTDPRSKILATGGASVNKHLLQIVSDVFNMPVYTSTTSSNSACLGCAYRAIYGYELDKVKSDGDHKTGSSTTQNLSFHNCMLSRRADIIDTQFIPTCTPIPDNVTIYNQMLSRYGRLESSITN